MKRVFLLTISIVLISGTLLFAGGQKEESDGITTVSFMTWNSGYNLDIEQMIVNKFEEQNPLIKVELISVPQGFDDKVLTSHAAGNTPDGLLMWNTPQFVKAGVVEDLTPFIERDNIDMDKYHPVTRLWAKYMGGIYGMPKDYTPRAIYYNKNVFDKAALSYPEEGWTFEDFKNVVKKLTNGKSGADARYGYVAVPGHTYAMQGYIWSNGGDLVSQDGTRATGYINSDAVIEVVKWYKELYDMSISTGTSDAYQNIGQTEFQTGIVGMMDNGSWPISLFKDDTSLKYGIVSPPVPRAGMKPSPVIHSATFSMFKHSKNKDAIWEYIKFASSEEGMKVIEGEQYSLGAIPAVTKISGLAEEPYFKEFNEIAKNADMAPVFTRNPRWFEADGEFATALESIFIGDTDIESTLTEAARKMDNILQDR